MFNLILCIILVGRGFDRRRDVLIQEILHDFMLPLFVFLTERVPELGIHVCRPQCISLTASWYTIHSVSPSRLTPIVSGTKKNTKTKLRAENPAKRRKAPIPLVFSTRMGVIRPTIKLFTQLDTTAKAVPFDLYDELKTSGGIAQGILNHDSQPPPSL